MLRYQPLLLAPFSSRLKSDFHSFILALWDRARLQPREGHRNPGTDMLQKSSTQLPVNRLPLQSKESQSQRAGRLGCRQSTGAAAHSKNQLGFFGVYNSLFYEKLLQVRAAKLWKGHCE